MKTKLFYLIIFFSVFQLKAQNGSNLCSEAPTIKYLEGFYNTTEWMKNNNEPQIGEGVHAMYYRFNLPTSSEINTRTLKIESCSVDRSNATLYVGKGSCGNIDQQARFAGSCLNSSLGRRYYNPQVTASASYLIEWNSQPNNGQIDAANDPFFWSWDYNGPETLEYDPSVEEVVFNSDYTSATVTFEIGEDDIDKVTGTYEVYLADVDKQHEIVLEHPTKTVTSTTFNLTGLKKRTSYVLYISANLKNGMKTGFRYNIDRYSLDTYDYNEEPTNDDLCNAITLEMDKESTNIEFTNLNSNSQTNEPLGSCLSGSANRTSWFKFTAPASGKVKISTDFEGQGYNDFDTELSLYNKPTNCQDLSTLTASIACDDDSGTVEEKSIITKSGLTPGEEYYVQVSGGEGFFGLQVNELPADAQEDAPEIEVNNTEGEYNMVNATDSGVATACGNPIVDYWVAFLAPASGKVTITTSTNNGNKTQIDVYEFVNDVLTSLGICGTDNVALKETIKTNQKNKTLNGLTPGKKYYIKVFYEAGKEFNNFNLKIADTNALSVTSEEVLQYKLSVYPNPAKEFFTILMRDNSIDNVELYSLIGKKLIDKKVNSNRFDVNSSFLTSGIYILKLNVEGKSITKKIIIH